MDLQLWVLVATIGGIALGCYTRQVKVNGKTGERLVRMETQLELFWKAITVTVTDLVKSPTNLRKDDLLDLLKNGDLSYEEAMELRVTLMDEYHRKDLDSSKKLAYALVMARLEIKILELGELDK